MTSVENKREKQIYTSTNFTKNDIKGQSGKINYKTKNDSSNEIDPDDPCIKKEEKKVKEPRIIPGTVGHDPRFQQQNQTMRCFVSYVDFFRCEKILGEGHNACEWFKDSYKTICPLRWIEDFDEARNEGRFPWHRRGQGKFPGNKYG